MADRDLLKSSVAPTPNCLSLAELERIASAPDQHHEHASKCPRCQSEVAMLRAFESDAALPAEGAAVAWISSQLDRRLEQIKNPRQQRRQQTRLWLGRLWSYGKLRLFLPAAVVSAVAIAIVAIRPSREPELSAHLGNGPTILRTEEIKLVRPAGEIPQAPQKLEWEAFPGVAKYKVQIMEVDESMLWTSQTTDNSVTIPASVRTIIIPGKTMLWRVTASDFQGRVIASSQIQRFVVPRRRK